jgi:hypothetical protein
MSKRQVKFFNPTGLKHAFSLLMVANDISERKRSVFFEEGLKAFIEKGEDVILNGIENESFEYKSKKIRDGVLLSDDTSVLVDGLVYRLKLLNPLLENIKSPICRATMIFMIKDDRWSSE